jgi:hypothetical protein
MSLELNPSNLLNACEFVLRATGRSIPESLNRAGLHAIIGSKGYPGAMQLTPKATVAQINQIPDSAIRAFVIKKAKRRGKWPMTRARVDEEVRRERKRRRSSVGYHAYAGWNQAAQALGGRGLRRGLNSMFPRSQAAKGYGSKATQGNLLAIISNRAPAIERIGVHALQTGLDNAGKDLVDYGTKKLQETFNLVKP